MIRRGAVVAAWTLVGALAVAGLYVTLFHLPPEPSPDGHAPGRARGGSPLAHAHPATADRPSRVEPRTSTALRIGERAGRSSGLGGFAGQRVEAQETATWFFSMFARYELGALYGVTAAMRATATRRFAATLLDAPARLERGSSGLEPARLGRLLFVPGEVVGSSRLHDAEVVGSVQRGGRRSPISIELIRSTRGWRVSGIGR